MVSDAGVAKTARQRAREEITAEILRAARLRLRAEGPAQLSLRAVARDVGMVSSAVYRYFASRDELLTALLVEVYNELGAATEAADATVADRADGRGRWRAVSATVREWALAHPGDYALLYGSPVPGYAAPQDTVAAAARVIFVIVGIVTDGTGATAAPEEPAEASVVLAPALEFASQQGFAVRASDGTVALRMFMAWTALFGTVSFELFGHLTGTVVDARAYFELVVERLADELGL